MNVLLPVLQENQVWVDSAVEQGGNLHPDWLADAADAVGRRQRYSALFDNPKYDWLPEGAYLQVCSADQWQTALDDARTVRRVAPTYGTAWLPNSDRTCGLLVPEDRTRVRFLAFTGASPDGRRDVMAFRLTRHLFGSGRKVELGSRHCRQMGLRCYPADPKLQCHCEKLTWVSNDGMSLIGCKCERHHHK